MCPSSPGSPCEVFSIEEEVGGIQSQAKDHKEPPEAIRGTGGVSSRTFGRSMFLLTPCCQTSALQVEGNRFLFFGAIEFVMICYGRIRATGAHSFPKVIFLNSYKQLLTVYIYGRALLNCSLGHLHSNSHICKHTYLFIIQQMFE